LRRIGVLKRTKTVDQRSLFLKGQLGGIEKWERLPCSTLLLLCSRRNDPRFAVTLVVKTVPAIVIAKLLPHHNTLTLLSPLAVNMT
jgi:hypothetical protein